MNKLLLGIICLLLVAGMGSAHAQECFIDGEMVVIPDNQKLVLVPLHWDVKDVYRESHRVQDISELIVVPIPCDEMEDELVIGGAICPSD